MESYSQLSLFKPIVPAAQKFRGSGSISYRSTITTTRPAWCDGLDGLNRLVARIVSRMALGDAFEVVGLGNRVIRVEYLSLARRGNHYKITWAGTEYVVHAWKRTSSGRMDNREAAKAVLVKWLIASTAGDVTPHQDDAEYVAIARDRFMDAEWSTALTYSRNAVKSGRVEVLL